jgi:hypothetical protein
VDLTGKQGDWMARFTGYQPAQRPRQFQTPIVTDKMSIIVTDDHSNHRSSTASTQRRSAPPPRGGPAPPANGSAPPGFPGRPGAFFDSQPKSGFYDGNAKYLWKPSSEQTVTVSYYTGKDEVDNSRTLQLPTQFLETLQNRGVNLAERGIDVSNPNLHITDLRVTHRHGMEWTARINSRIGTQPVNR